MHIYGIFKGNFHKLTLYFHLFKYLIKYYIAYNSILKSKSKQYLLVIADYFSFPVGSDEATSQKSKVIPLASLKADIPLYIQNDVRQNFDFY